MSDFPTLGHWLFSGLGAQSACCLRQPDRKLTFGVFNPDAPADRLLVSKEQFEGRYGLPFTNAGSLIGEGRVPDKVELQERVRRADNPCQLAGNASYVVTETDVSDFRYVAKSGRPVWEEIERLGTFATVPEPGRDPAAVLDATLRDLTALMEEFRGKLPATGGGRFVAAGRDFLRKLDKLVESARALP
ncbi:MAG TPA: hypothetical protein VGX68_11090 [Thermoanaerobaculia bacterium]|jgi:hypothetical protein|nr:hypothetical protein [Thermoanaerobaculia bacterium]